jgi:hypothetical protein
VADVQLGRLEIQMLQAARSLEAGSAPPPWVGPTVIPGAGITAGGWDADENVLLISPDGYSLTEPMSGTRLGRDRSFASVRDGLSADRLRFKLPGQHDVPIFGIWGGDGIHTTDDGWRLQIIHPWWPRDHVVIWSPVSRVRSDNYFEGAHLLALHSLEDVRLKCGFAPSGRRFMILGSSGAEVYTR